MPPVILTDNLHKTHSAPIFSRTGIASLIVIFSVFFLPLLLVRMTHNYWIDTQIYFEQPNIKHLNEVLVFVNTDDAVYSFGSTKNLNDLIDGSREEATRLAPQFNVSFFLR